MGRLMPRSLNSRISIWVLMALLMLVLFTLFYRVNDAASWPIPELDSSNTTLPEPASASETVDLGYPPSYRSIRKKEQSLPQHNLDLPFPEGRNGRYVKFSCQIQQLGWNNVLNELYVTMSYHSFISLHSLNGTPDS
jgi:hypothetical protein